MLPKSLFIFVGKKEDGNIIYCFFFYIPITFQISGSLDGMSSSFSMTTVVIVNNYDYNFEQNSGDYFNHYCAESLNVTKI